MQTSKPALELLTSDAIYRENPTALFHQLCGARPATLLLESADIDSKDDLKSLLLVDSALRITALGDTVTIHAFSANGTALLELLDSALPSGIDNQRQPNSRVLTFPPVSALLDEDARLTLGIRRFSPAAGSDYRPAGGARSDVLRRPVRL